MLENKQNLPRILTGTTLLSLLFLILILPSIYLFILMVIFTTLAMWEFYTMFWPDHEGISRKIFALVMGILILTTGWIKVEALTPIIGISFILTTIYTLITCPQSTALYFKQIGILLFGIFYIPVLLVPIFTCSIWEQFFLICLVTISDTTAYFIGGSYGKHKIWPKISPKKSIEGSTAGLCACIIFTICIGFIFGKTSILSFLILAIILGIMAQLGDFFESSLKRATHLKDSGNILPGHGGILDRADSILFVIPTYVLLKSSIPYF